MLTVMGSGAPQQRQSQMRGAPLPNETLETPSTIPPPIAMQSANLKQVSKTEIEAPSPPHMRPWRIILLAVALAVAPALYYGERATHPPAARTRSGLAATVTLFHGPNDCVNWEPFLKEVRQSVKSDRSLSSLLELNWDIRSTGTAWGAFEGLLLDINTPVILVADEDHGALSALGGCESSEELRAFLVSTIINEYDLPSIRRRLSSKSERPMDLWFMYKSLQSWPAAGSVEAIIRRARLAAPESIREGEECVVVHQWLQDFFLEVSERGSPIAFDRFEPYGASLIHDEARFTLYLQGLRWARNSGDEMYIAKFESLATESADEAGKRLVASLLAMQ